MKVAIYLRKSRADLELEANGEMETLARHEKILLDVARKQRLVVSSIYKEIVSGETIAARPVMQKLIDEVEAGVWEGVLVMEIERLARGDTIDQGIVARAFKAYNTKIVTPTKTYDPSNEFDEEYFEFGLFMSRREYKTINRRIQRGRVQSAKDGKYLGSVPPYGYDRIRIKGDKGYTLTPNQEADSVRLMFDLYLKGKGATAISRHLDKLQVRPRLGDHWSKASVMDILKNPVYIGKISWSKGNHDILSDGLHPAIIEQSVFDSAQVLRKKNTRPPVKIEAKLRNPFAGLVYCKKCGVIMTRLGENSRNKYATLRCSNRYCTNVSAPIYLIEKQIEVELVKWIEEYKMSVMSKDFKSEDNERVAREAAYKSALADLEKADAQIEKAYDLLEQEIYTTEVFLSRSAALTKRKEELEQTITKIEQKISESKRDTILDIKAVENLIEVYLSTKSVEGKNQIIRKLLHRVEYEKDLPNRRGQRDNVNFNVVIYPKLPKT